MPCTLEPWEIEVEESRANKKEFGKEIPDLDVAVEAACQACRTLESLGHMDGKSKKVSPFLLKWWRAHKRWDKSQGRSK
jgi:hypothetical protein